MCQEKEAEQRKEREIEKQKERLHSIPTRLDAEKGRYIDVNRRVLPLRSDKEGEKSGKESEREGA